MRSEDDKSVLEKAQLDLRRLLCNLKISTINFTNTAALYEVNCVLKGWYDVNTYSGTIWKAKKGMYNWNLHAQQ